MYRTDLGGALRSCRLVLSASDTGLNIVEYLHDATFNMRQYVVLVMTQPWTACVHFPDPVSYRRLSSPFQFSLSAVTLEYLSQWSLHLAMFLAEFVWPANRFVFLEFLTEGGREGEYRSQTLLFYTRELSQDF
jgi:hypothetical protein